MPKFKYLLLFPFFLLLFSCSNNPLEVDTKNVNIKPIELKRLDRDLFAINTQNFEAENPKLIAKYGAFYNTFIYNIINRGEAKDSVKNAIKSFVSDPDLKKVYTTVQAIYTDAEMKKIENELEQAMKYFKYHFPKQVVPDKYAAYISGFNYNITTTDSTLGIGLDMFMGAENEFYTMLRWPNYQRRGLSKEYIVTSCMRGWIVHSFDSNEPINNLINHMIFYGKLYYCLDAVLPNESDSIKIGYSVQQMSYCTKYEKDIWKYFTEKDRLYTNDLKLVSEFTSDGPFTSAISKECPPRIAMYVGWQIVRAYMKRNGNVSLMDLMKEKDAQKILSKSKYKP
jgi:hypothetical protein